MDARTNDRHTSAAWTARAPFRLRTALAVTASVLAMLSFAAAPAGADAASPLHVVSQSAVYCPGTGTVSFTLTFDQRPKFNVVDANGRQQDSFQYFIIGDPTQPYPGNYDAIVRGPEITQAGATGSLPIRASDPSDPDPAAQGWGHVRTTVPVRLTGRTLTFSGPLSAFSDHSSDGVFTYELETYSFGSTIDHLTGQSTVGNC